VVFALKHIITTIKSQSHYHAAILSALNA